MTADEIQKTLIRSSQSPAFLRANFIVIPNVSWSIFKWGEADLIAVTKNLYMNEFEIKTNLQDLEKDFLKTKWDGWYFEAWKKQIKKFYYVVPISLFEKAQNTIIKNHINPSLCGIIGVSISQSGGYTVNKKVNPLKLNNEALKLDDKDIINLCRISSFRFWRSSCD